MQPRVLVIGIDPRAAVHLGIDAEAVLAALAREQARFDAAGIPAQVCSVGLDQHRAFDQIVEQLTAQEYTVRRDRRGYSEARVNARIL